MSGFHDVRLPLALAMAASGGPEWKTDVVPLASGKEWRNGLWSRPKRRWDVGGAAQSRDDLEALTRFFEARRGRLYSFRFRDVADWRSCAAQGDISPFDQLLGTGDGAATAFQLVKHYESGGETSLRKITKSVTDSVRVAVDGAEIETGWSVDHTMGLITFDQAPQAGAPVTAGFEFDAHARFDTDFLNISLSALNAGRLVSAPIIEILD